ncbi:hypothetical protein MBRA_56210 (plasmid) [Mycobacterium branderi]|uniref:Uncharacterized protein n=1 Tax=Mycobacterium branderi TaxID=43348 RepID=A0ABN6BHX1_9MYCO|nr:hypothetical protein MBRA_56210 [Mycobacterium branderi]
MAHKDDVTKIVPIENTHNVGDVGFEVHRRAEQVSALSEPGKRRREDVVAASAKPISHPLPAPSTVHASRNEHKR